MPVALQDIPIGEPFLFEFDGPQGQDTDDTTYQGEKVYQRPDGKALLTFSTAEIGIGNRLAYLSPDVWYCIAEPQAPGYFHRLDCFSPQYWQFKDKSPEEIMAFGAENPDGLEIYRMQIIPLQTSQEDGFRIGRA